MSETFGSNNGKHTSEKLDPSDAIFVDVIHTSANARRLGSPAIYGTSEAVIQLLNIKYCL